MTLSLLVDIKKQQNHHTAGFAICSPPPVHITCVESDQYKVMGRRIRNTKSVLQEKFS